MRSGVQGGSNVISTSTESTPGTREDTVHHTVFQETSRGATRASCRHRNADCVVDDRDIVDEAEIDDVVTELGIDHNAHRVANQVDQLACHDGALTVS
jgi:hypothetical protein